jgi:N-acetylmuramoyl-L-alanine amidase
MTAAPDSPLATLWCPSPNHEPRRNGRRPDLLLLHYTGMDSCDAALDWLTRPEARVSSHYLIDEKGRIVQMVAEAERAWHAGLSHWAGEDDINSCSIGIEIHNPGHELGYTGFPEPQMAAVEALARDIVARNAIAPERVLAHSDVAPARKADPGEKFDWARLARAGVGLWVEPAADEGDAGLGSGDAGDTVLALQERLKALGYGLEASGVYDRPTQLAVTAFQRHWRPARVDGRLDRSTDMTLDKLLAEMRVRSI